VNPAKPVTTVCAVDPEELLAEAEEQIEAWLCELDAEWARVLADAEARAAAIIEQAELDARALLAGAGRLAAMQIAEADAEAERTRSLAAESRQTAAAIAAAADATVSGRVGADDLAALGHAVERLRIELSRIVDAAFDALPAVEATAAALQLEQPATTASAPVRTRGFVRRLLRV
jgi:hypothetical protein